MTFDARIDGQTLRYDHAGFRSQPTVPMGQTVTNVVTFHPTDLWTYAADITPTGPVVRDVVLQSVMSHDGGPTMAYEQPVLSWLEFGDLFATIAHLDDRSTERLPIDLTRAASVTAVQGSDPHNHIPGLFPAGEYQEGICFTALVPVIGAVAGHAVVVEVVLAVAFRGAAADFDPPKAIEAAPLFPQISFRQIDPVTLALDPADFAATVRTFEGTVRMVADVNTPSMMRDEMIRDLYGTSPTAAERASFPSDGTNYAAVFADMWNLNFNVVTPELELLWTSSQPSLVDLLAVAGNPAAGLVRLYDDVRESVQKAEWMLRMAQAQWLGFFDYVERIYPQRLGAGSSAPPLPGARVFAGLGAAGDPVLDDYRWGIAQLDWPAPGPGTIARRINKERRQGAYDNCHLHGTMGTIGDIDATDLRSTPRVMAPGCGHSCFHAHWRWGNSTFFLSSCDPAHPERGVAQLMASVGLHDFLLQALGPLVELDAEDLASALAEVILNMAPDVVMPPTDRTLKGWSSEGASSRRYQIVGGGLVPPNQHLDVAVGGDPGAVGAPFPTSVVDQFVKTEEFRTTVDCHVPYDPRWRHCCTEFPVAVAVRYPASAAATTFRFVCATYFQDILYLPQSVLDALAALQGVAAGTCYSTSRVFARGYDVIPFFDSTDPHEIVHATNAGTDTTVLGTVLEDL